MFENHPEFRGPAPANQIVFWSSSTFQTGSDFFLTFPFPFVFTSASAFDILISDTRPPPPAFFFRKMNKKKFFSAKSRRIEGTFFKIHINEFHSCLFSEKKKGGRGEKRK
jgi:hypothetical protein